jgi:uncharacterized Ntn-hydrolase superfamily protein
VVHHRARSIDGRDGDRVGHLCRAAELRAVPRQDLRDVPAIVVPGRGIAAAQARVDTTRANQQLIFDHLLKGTPPEEIIELLRADPGFEGRQFAILDMEGRAAGFSGAKNQPASLHRQGRVEGTGIHYSVQGNILASEAVVLDAVRALGETRGTLADRVMAAMEAADARGGDTRCSCDRGPKVAAPCTAKTSHVAYLLQAEKTDPVPGKYNEGQFPVHLSVTDENITAGEDANPVRTLRMRYDAWKGRKR